MSLFRRSTPHLQHHAKCLQGVQHAFEDFRWMHENISSQPTCIAKLVPMPTVAEGQHDASGLGAGGIWFPSSVLPPREGFVSATPVVAIRMATLHFLPAKD
jgi:hypothetical protein